MIWTILEVIWLLFMIVYIVVSQATIKKLKAENLTLKADETLYLENKWNDEFHIFKELRSAKDGKTQTVEYVLDINYITETVRIKKVKTYDVAAPNGDVKPEPLFDEALLQEVNKNSGIDKEKLFEL